MTQVSTPTPKTEENLPAIAPPRLPYHPLIEQRFGVDRASWKALVEAIFPNAQSVESVILALSYCRARTLDPFKRNVHIVPIWDSNRKCLVDTIWPGIGELRTTAFRTGEYAGRDPAAFGPDLTQKVGTMEVTFPEWAQVTLYRMVKGNRVAFSGPRVYWLETYAVKRRDDDTPNEMWATRTRGQIEKCAEAAALRAAFPEEVGSDYIPEEVQHKHVESTSGPAKAPPMGSAALLGKLKGEAPDPATSPLEPGGAEGSPEGGQSPQNAADGQETANPAIDVARIALQARWVNANPRLKKETDAQMEARFVAWVAKTSGMAIEGVEGIDDEMVARCQQAMDEIENPG